MVLAVAALSVVTTGCFGSFQMTRNLYTWNKGVGNKWTQELVYLVVGGLVPVYGLAGLIDAVVLNSIEFWTGKNPMTASTTKTFEQDGKRVVQTLRSDVRGRTEIVTISTASGPVSTVTRFQPAGSSVITSTTKYADGRVETKTVSATDEPVKY
jgi:hypothetical protein